MLQKCRHTYNLFNPRKPKESEKSVVYIMFTLEMKMHILVEYKERAKTSVMRTYLDDFHTVFNAPFKSASSSNYQKREA